MAAEVLPYTTSAVGVTGLALALAGSVSALAAVVTGVLAAKGGANPANAAIKGGTAFGGALALAVAILGPLGLLQAATTLPSVGVTGLALALAGSVSALAAVVTGVLAAKGGANPANAAIKGGTAFGVTLALAVAVPGALGLL
ncbi:hypothetical protein [Frankia sp. CiP3]|uniref:hypothetical protein n=1 Tax=Frankia sp. CiP3 TaxID=2880971 RepID=UPI001EF422F7|nr:hypothetical protein [Frankia sp. CiP3]